MFYIKQLLSYCESQIKCETNHQYFLADHEDHVKSVEKISSLKHQLSQSVIEIENYHFVPTIVYFSCNSLCIALENNSNCSKFIVLNMLHGISLMLQATHVHDRCSQFKIAKVIS